MIAFFRALLFTFFLPLFSSLAFAETGFVAAKVNNHIITNSDLEDRYRFVIASSKIKVNSSEEMFLLMNQVIDKMIDEELIRQEGDNLKIALADEELKNSIESIAMHQKKSVASFKNFFTEKKLSFFSFENQLRSDLIWSKIVTDSVKSRIKITDAEIKEFLEQKISTDVIKFLIAEIFIPNDVNSKILASKLAIELKNGANFNSIVKQFSRSPTAENGGEVGFVSKSDIDTKIYDAISVLEKNQYSDPVSLGDGYYIFKLLNKKTVTEIKENDLLDARRKIFARELETESKRYLMDLRKNSFIEVSRDKIFEKYL